MEEKLKSLDPPTSDITEIQSDGYLKWRSKYLEWNTKIFFKWQESTTFDLKTNANKSRELNRWIGSMYREKWFEICIVNHLSGGRIELYF